HHRHRRPRRRDLERGGAARPRPGEGPAEEPGRLRLRRLARGAVGGRTRPERLVHRARGPRHGLRRRPREAVGRSGEKADFSALSWVTTHRRRYTTRAPPPPPSIPIFIILGDAHAHRRV